MDDAPQPAESTAQPAKPRRRAWRKPAGMRQRLDDLWARAARGEEVPAYRELLRVHALFPGHPEACVRLYWLLKALPELDALRSPCDWLERGLHAAGLTGPLRELYRRELTAHPEEALSARCHRLLHCRVSPELIRDLAQMRWLAVGALGRWDIVAQDLEELRGATPDEPDDAWALLLLLACEHLAWVGDRGDRSPHPLLEHYRQEANARGVPSRLPEAWKRCERAVALARGCQELAGSASALPCLIRISWHQPPEVWHKSLMVVVLALTRTGDAALHALDDVHHRAPVLVTRLLELLRQTLAGNDAQPIAGRSTPQLRMLAWEFFDGLRRAKYAQLRPQVLRFCLQEAIAPEELAAIAGRQRDGWLLADQHLAQMLAADEPLAAVYLAHQVFWL